MKVSNIGLISKKLEQLDEQFPVQDMLIQTGQLMQFTSGIYAYGHIPYLLEKKIYKSFLTHSQNMMQQKFLCQFFNQNKFGKRVVILTDM